MCVFILIAPISLPAALLSATGLLKKDSRVSPC